MTLLKTAATEPPPFPVRRFSVREYHELGRLGVLTEADRVELLEGWIVPAMIRSPQHDVAIDLVEESLRTVVPPSWRVRVQSAITTPDSEPEPDLAIVRGPARRYRTKHPGPSDIALVIEVADATLPGDRLVKGRLYARAGIPYYWIVNLRDRRIEVYSNPSGAVSSPAYGTREIFGPRKSVLLVIEGDELARLPVRLLLP